jgi:GMP synthase-like glutamine amidotransferase
MGAYEDDDYAWLVPEKRLIRAAVRSGLPFWGVCLGAQLLAASLGASVRPGPEPEVGVFGVQTLPAAATDPVFKEAPAMFDALHWHNDTFDVPEGATLLASSAAYAHQAFVWRRAYGLQFHLEASAEAAGEWAGVPQYAASLEELQGAGGLERLVEQVEALAGEAMPLARHLFGRWLERVVRARTQLPGLGTAG